MIETFRLGLTNLMLHKLRSLLTALGIIIGVGAVVAIAAYTEGTKQAALAQFKEQGANNIILRSVKPPESVESDSEEEESSGSIGGETQGIELQPYGLTRLDYSRLQSDSVQPVEEIVPLKRVGTFVFKNDVTVVAAKVYGTLATYPKIVPMTIARGRYLTPQDGERLSSVAVLGADAAQDLFRLEDALGNTFRIDQHSFTVVGVLEPVGLTAGRDINHDIYIPLATASNRYGDRRMLKGGKNAELIELSELIIRVPETEDVIDVAAKVRRVIEVAHPVKDVKVIVPLEQIRNKEKTEMRNTILMIVIASLSLIVGGIGIMNIMLASVTERVREIGVRRALGATRRHIIAQFLVETTVLSIIGGVVGVLLGLLIVLWPFVADYVWPVITLLSGFARPDETIKPVPVPWSMIVGFTSAVMVGLLAGLYPAIRAAWQDPIVALRHD